MSDKLSYASDSELVSHTLEGRRDAYRHLVERHKGAVCAIAYTVLGDFSRSEDVAQDAFVSAWKSLPDLHEKSRFRSWVCGMARRMALNLFRRQRNQRAETPLPEELADQTALPDSRAMNREEATLLWNCLNQLDEQYREPLVLYYREGQSTSAVAEALELSEQSVRQRLHRGRNLLREEMARRFEELLRISAPGPTFSAGVMASLPAYALGAIAAASATKASASSTTLYGTAGTAKISGGAGAGLLTTLAPFVSGILGLAGIYLLFSFVRSPTLDRNSRRILLRSLLLTCACNLAFALGVAWLILTRCRVIETLHLNPALVVAGAVVVFCLMNASCIRVCSNVKEQIRSAREKAVTCDAARIEYLREDYVSKIRFLGLPLIHVARNRQGLAPHEHLVARGWIALGERACGGLVAMGGIAVAPLAFGGVSIGVISFGGFSFGALALGALGMGWIGCGGLAVAWEMTVGAMTMAHNVAVGGFAVSAKMGFGTNVYAPLINDGASWKLFFENSVAGTVYRLLPYASWASLAGLPGIIMGFRHLRKVRKAQKQNSSD